MNILIFHWLSPIVNAVFQGVGERIKIDAVLDTAGLFHYFKDLPPIKKAEMDDDCERAIFRAFHILVILKEQKAVPEDHFGT